MSISAEEARAYLVTVGKKGLKTLGTIEALRPFIEMMESELGSEFLRDDITQHSHLIIKIYGSLIKDGSAEQRDVIHLQMLHGRLQKTYDRLAVYSQSVKSVKETKK